MSKKVKTLPWDFTKYIETEEDILAILDDAYSDGDPSIIQKAIKDVTKAKLMTDLAKLMGIPRRDLYPSFDDDSLPRIPNKATILKALGIKQPAKTKKQPLTTSPKATVVSGRQPKPPTPNVSAMSPSPKKQPKKAKPSNVVVTT